MDFWTEALMESIRVERAKLEGLCRGGSNHDDVAEGERNIVFAALGAFAYNMLR
jgi:hypothetical protein